MAVGWHPQSDLWVCYFYQWVCTLKLVVVLGRGVLGYKWLGKKVDRGMALITDQIQLEIL